MNYSLAISLGHNSSAVLISPDGEILGGYETERFDLVKSSSKFPYMPIEQLMNKHNLHYDDIDAYVGHWFTSGNLPSTSTKHCDSEYLAKFRSVNSLSKDLTHHDSHLESAKVFAGQEFWSEGKTIALVMDGFGTMGECMSIYEVDNRGHKLMLRAFGYMNSLGMLYQYATDFMRMKMNNHEYKILAYEVHIQEINADTETLDYAASEYSKDILSRIFSGKIVKDYDPIVNTSALLDTMKYVKGFLHDTLDNSGVDIQNEYALRVATAYLVQKIVELTVMEIRKMVPSDNLLLAGGLFYNVKLNSMLCDTAKKFCVFPIAGDQGAALGVYNAYRGDLIWPEHVFWGHRNLRTAHGDGILCFDTSEEAKSTIESELHRIGFVNLVRGAMEFGPRALCNTSTLAIPALSVTEKVNMVNDRTAEMPMAPVMTKDQAHRTFSEIDKVHKSLEYMIVTRDYHDGEAYNMMGAAHYYPDMDKYTGRPQITQDPMMVSLLDTFGPLVNTSFNYHGYPIVMGGDDIINSHVLQNALAENLKIKTVVITGE